MLSEQSRVQRPLEDGAGWSCEDPPVAVLTVDADLCVRRANLGATVGIAFANGHRDLPSDLIDRADLAMYRAKERGWDSALADSETIRATGEVASIDLTEPTTLDGHRCVRLDGSSSAR